MERLALLLRGINVGGRRRVGMAELRDLLEELGYEDVRTLLQSGNAVVGAADAPDAVVAAVEKGIRERFGLDVGVVVRTAAEIADVVAANPLGDVATDGAKQVVVFLSAEPDPEALAQIDAAALAPERFVVRGREIHAWLPGGQQRSPLMQALSRPSIAPGAIATVRNWNTVTKLRDMLA